MSGYVGVRSLAISIHALREEGDTRALWAALSFSYFYPRPPRGGRRSTCVITEFSR